MIARALILAGAIAALPAAAAPADAASAVLPAGAAPASGVLSPPSWSSASPRAYWTPERRRQAEAAAEAGSAPEARAARRRSWRSASPKAAAVTTPAPGWSTMGRVYATKPDGTPYACSATLVASANGSVVWTAGHCLDGGRRSAAYTNVVFAPGLRPGAHPSGEPPYGLWTAVRTGTTGEWAFDGSVRRTRRDVGAVVVGRDAAGRTITEALGVAQRLSFRPRAYRRRRLDVFGYPGSGRFTGNNALHTCSGRRIGRLRSVPGTGPRPRATRCEMSAGSSGGAWMAGVGADGLGTVVGVTSSALVGRRILYGPVHDRTVRRLFRAMESVPV